MSKEVFGEYAAFDSGKGIRFQKSNKLVSESAVPPEVVSYLKNKITVNTDVAKELPKDAPKFPRPTEEQLKAMREESLKPAPGLELTPEEEAARASQPLPEPQPVDTPPLEEGDFDIPELDGQLAPPQDNRVPMGLAGVPTTEEQIAGIVEAQVQEHPTEVAAREAEEKMSEYMEQNSIYTADIKDIAQALYDRFGIYSIYLNVTPQTDEVNPLTGEAFSRYHQGIAYQALIKARNSGFFNRDPERKAELMTEGRVAHENYTKEVGDPRQRQYAPAPPDATQDSPESFAYRTSPAANAPKQTHYISHEPDPVTGELRAVRREIPQASQHSGKVNNATQRFDAGQDEMIVEPQIGSQVIRPNW